MKNIIPICRHCRFLSDHDSDSGICLNPASEFDGCLQKGTETCREFTAYGVYVGSERVVPK